MNLYEGSSFPLEGLRVVDWSTAVAAPTCGRLLADLGADVIKIETPGGDMSRRLGPVYNVPITPESNPFFITANSNKRFITLDPRSDEGKEVLFRLLETADVFMTNVRGKVLRVMGLGYEELQARFPRLIFAHFTGFGYNGDEADRPGYDVAAFWARSGGLIDWVPPGTVPINPGIGAGDVLSGTTFFSGIMAALYARQNTGRGTLVTTSLMGAGIWGNGNFIFVTQPPYNHPVPADPALLNTPFLNSYECKDDVWITVVMPGAIAPLWEKGCRAFGLEAYVDDPRFGTDENIAAHNSKRELYELMRDAFRQRTFAEWSERLSAEEIVYEKVRHSRELVNDAQALANGYLEEVTLPDGKRAFYPTVPIQFSEYKLRPVNPHANEGQDTKAILTELGYTKEQIERMYADKTVR